MANSFAQERDAARYPRGTPTYQNWTGVYSCSGTRDSYPGSQLSSSNTQVSVRMAHHAAAVSRRCVMLIGNDVFPCRSKHRVDFSGRLMASGARPVVRVVSLQALVTSHSGWSGLRERHGLAPMQPSALELYLARMRRN